jgi:cardiolipin synthase
MVMIPGADHPLAEPSPALAPPRTSGAQTRVSGDVVPVHPGPAFARGLWRIAAADVSSGNDVHLLPDGATTFDSMIAMIDAARESVVLESYIFRGDDVGLRFADALGRAAARGATVRFLLDWLGAFGLSGSILRRLRQQRVAVRTFSPPGFRAWGGFVPRDHRKLLVVDGAAGVTGGIGIGTEWRTGVLKRRRSPWRDTAIRIDGPAASDMLRAFDRMWSRVSGHERRRSGRVPVRRAHGAHLDPALDAPSLVGIVEGEPGRRRVARALQMQAVSAERSIWIASAYFVPAFSELEALIGAARDGVDVRVLVPSRYDHPWIRLLTRQFYRRLLVNGVRIWEWAGEMMHAKTSVIDGRWIRVGSTDFNPLGVAINYELDAVVEDPRVGAEAEAMFLRDLDQSREIRLRSLPGSR